MSLGTRLAELRRKAGKSLQAAADDLGISKTHLWQLEKGASENPSLDLLTKLATYYRVPLEYLTGGEKDISLNEAKALQLFRDLRKLSPQEQAYVEQTIDLLKKRK